MCEPECDFFPKQRSRSQHWKTSKHGGKKNLLSPWTKMWKLSARISAYGHHRVTVIYTPAENSYKTRQNIWEKCFQVLSQGKAQACDIQEKGITWGDPGFPSRSNLWPFCREVEAELKRESGGGINEGCGRLLRWRGQDLWGRVLKKKEFHREPRSSQRFPGRFVERAGCEWAGRDCRGPSGDHGLRAERRPHSHAALEAFRGTAEPEFRHNSGCLRHPWGPRKDTPRSKDHTLELSSGTGVQIRTNKQQINKHWD